MTYLDRTLNRPAMEPATFLEQFRDYLASKLDTYGQAIHLFIFRHSRHIGLEEAVIRFKSAGKRIAGGVGQ